MAINTVSRRSFVSASAALAALGMAGIQAGMAHADEKAQDAAAGQECDVLVIGGGISGALAALSAADAGAKSVVLCEKQSFIGGSAALSSGFMVTVNNDNFPESIDDSWDKMSSVLHGVHDQSPDTTYPNWDRLGDLFAQQSATIDFMLGLGMTAQFDEKSTAVTMWDGKGAGMMDSLAKAMDDNAAIDVKLDSPATKLLVNESGAVCGAEFAGKDGDFTVTAKKVIMACGGASHNEEILESFIPTIGEVDLDNQSAAGNTGDGFGMCTDLGAQLYPTMSLEEGGASTDASWKTETGFRPGVNDKLIVDADGARFTNEAPSGTGAGQVLVYYMVQHGSPKYWCIYDAATADDDTKAALDKGVEMGCVYFGDDATQLAEAMGADPATFADTFAAYQDACAAGKDDEFDKPAEKLVAYDDSEGLYAIYIRPSSWGTIGGVMTDDDFHVLDADSAPIANLFAVGEMSNREFFSVFYVGGNSLALNSTAGRLAGATAVAEL